MFDSLVVDFADHRKTLPSLREAERFGMKSERKLTQMLGDESKFLDKVPEDVKYIDILIDITLNFIRAEYPDQKAEHLDQRSEHSD